MTKAVRRAFRDRLHQNERVQARLRDPDAKPGNRASRRSGASDPHDQPEPAFVRRFRRALDKAVRGPRDP